MNHFTARLFIASSIIAVASSAFAAPAYSFPLGKGGGLIQPSFDAVEGNLFQVGATDILVTALGYEYQRANQGSELTAIFDKTTGAILASASISGTDPLVDGYYYANIAGLTLKAGKQYYIGSLHGHGAGEEYIFNTRTAQTSLGVIDLGTYFKVSSTLAGGTWEFGGGSSQYGPGAIRHYVGNFISQPVPEPMSMAALGFGALALLRRRRRR